MSSTPLTHEEAQELLAVYALDAVDPDEAERIEEHLRDCPRCRAEVAAHRETATVLGHGHVEPPAALWDRVSASLDDGAPPIDLARYRRPRRALAVAAIAAGVAAILGLGAITVQQRRDLDRVEAAIGVNSLRSAALAAFADPAARRATLRAADGAVELRAVVLRDGTGYLVADRLEALPLDRAYQLWAMVGDQPISAGVLGRDPTVAGFHVGEGTSALAITVERAAGAARPSLPALAQGILES